MEKAKTLEMIVKLYYILTEVKSLMSLNFATPGTRLPKLKH